MKALRYLLIAMSLVGVLSVSAQTPKYGKPYTPSNGTFYNPQAQMPEIQMRSTGSAIMYTGSALPFAASEGVTTTNDPAKTGPRRSKKEDDNPGGGFNSDDNDNDRDEPWKNPIGDALWPLALLALVYGVWCRVYRRKRSRSANGSQEN